MGDDEELDEIKRKKLQELQLEGQQQEAMEEQKKQLEAQKHMLMRKILTPKARERLGTLRTARPELAANIEDQLILLARSGKVKGRITDEEFRNILSKIMPQKREIQIKRK